jgi:murein DD-endopeptidase MepM/ murein hydrolase activator NlpD
MKLKITLFPVAAAIFSCMSLAPHPGACAVGNPVPSVKEKAGAGSESKGRRGKKSDLEKPEKLAEIIEKAIQVSGTNDSGQATLDLPVTGRITSEVGLRHDPFNGDLRMHNGVDIAIAEGTAVFPVAPGLVIYSGDQPGYGNMVIVRHDDGMMTIYAHHSRNEVKKGDRVHGKTRIARSGSTGRSTGPHLHFEAWQGGRNVTQAFLPNFAGFGVTAATDASLDRTNLKKLIMSDGTILIVETVRKKNPVR